MPNTQSKIRNKRNFEGGITFNLRTWQLVSQLTLNQSLGNQQVGSNPTFSANALNLKAQVSSLQAERLNLSKVACRKVARLLAVKGKILVKELGFSFPVGLFKLPVVGGFFF